MAAKSKTTSKRKRSAGSLPRRVKRLLDFPEPPPQMPVTDARWPLAFAEWTERKAKWLGLEDSFDLMGRALGIKTKTMDAYQQRRRDERRAKQKRLEDMAESSSAIYGKPLNDQAHPTAAGGTGGAQKGL